MYTIPIAQPKNQPSLSPTVTVNTTYDVSQEYPTDPYKLALAWANCFWTVTSTYNGK